MNNTEWRWFLAGAASAGVVITGVESSLAMYQLCKENPVTDGEWTLWKRIKKAFPYYIPTLVFGGATIGGVLGSNAIADHTEKILTATILSALAMRDQNRKKLEEVFDDPGEVEVLPRKEMKGDEELYFDMTLSVDDGYFSATPEEIVVALYRLNKDLQLDHTVAYERFYLYLGLPVPKACMDKGWSIGAGVIYGYEWIDADLEDEVLDDGLVVHKFKFYHEPREDYLDYVDNEMDYED